MKFNKNKQKLFIHENASEHIVCKMAAILSRGWVDIEIVSTKVVLHPDNQHHTYLLRTIDTEFDILTYHRLAILLISSHAFVYMCAMCNIVTSIHVSTHGVGAIGSKIEWTLSFIDKTIFVTIHSYSDHSVNIIVSTPICNHTKTLIHTGQYGLSVLWRHLCYWIPNGLHMMN